MNRWRRLGFAALLVGMMIARPAPATAQVVTSEISGVVSDASTIAEVVTEIAATNVTERGETRADDRFSEAAMEDRKRVGYF